MGSDACALNRQIAGISRCIIVVKIGDRNLMVLYVGERTPVGRGQD